MSHDMSYVSTEAEGRKPQNGTLHCTVCYLADISPNDWYVGLYGHAVCLRCASKIARAVIELVSPTPVVPS